MVRGAGVNILLGMCLAGKTSNKDGSKVNYTLIKLLSKELVDEFFEAPFAEFA
jgi:hypothetical protein